MDGHNDTLPMDVGVTELIARRQKRAKLEYMCVALGPVTLIHSTWKGRLQCFSTGSDSDEMSSSLDSATSPKVVPRLLSVIIFPRGTDAVFGVVGDLQVG
jgi:hypothetical protein